MNKNVNIKKILSLILTPALVFALTACSNGYEDVSSMDPIVTEEEIIVTEGTESQESEISNSQSTTVDNQEDYSEYKGQTVKMLMWRDLNKFEKETIKKFENKTGIKVSSVAVSQIDYANKVAAEIASSSGLDICAIQPGGMSVNTKDAYNSLFPVGAINTMQPFFEATGQDENDPIWDKSWMDPYKINNKYYGVAIAGNWHTLSTVIYYNKDLFEENGITTPKELWKNGNWNWDTFKESALSISNLGDAYWGFATRDNHAYESSAQIDQVVYNGKQFVNAMSDSKFRDAWEFYNGMISSKAQLEGDGKSNFPQMFIEGRLGMYGDGSYCMMNIGMLGDYAYDINNLTFEMDCVPFPSPKGQPSVVVHRANLFGIAKNAKNPKAAGIFLRYWLDPSNNESFEKVAVNKSMKDTFDWINNKSVPKYPMISGGVVGYYDIGRHSYITGLLMHSPVAQIPSIIAQAKPYVDAAIEQANSILK